MASKQQSYAIQQASIQQAYAAGLPAPAPIYPDHLLTVSDFERLAKAGITMTWNDIEGHVVQDGPATPPLMLTPNQRSLEEAFWDRWHRAHVQDLYSTKPYRIEAHQHGDKVTVFVCPADEEPFILTDQRPLYPSDALMASLALWEKQHGKN